MNKTLLAGNHPLLVTSTQRTNTFPKKIRAPVHVTTRMLAAASTFIFICAFGIADVVKTL